MTEPIQHGGPARPDDPHQDEQQTTKPAARSTALLGPFLFALLAGLILLLTYLAVR